ncbi:MAG TPA: Mth938-like domain-containing protein [Gemmatimonadota bacterium]|nr:Mth938-like domain-containing protein [Gemmatimonadota bacterium]
MAHDRAEPNASPRIRSLAWGRIEVEGADAPYKDAKLWPGGSREWDWNETGTRHEPGIQPADVQELLAHGATTIVLSRGVQRRLRVRPETLQMLEEEGVTAHVLQTEEAVRLYNELRQREAVGGLFHSTC